MHVNKLSSAVENGAIRIVSCLAVPAGCLLAIGCGGPAAEGAQSAATPASASQASVAVDPTTKGNVGATMKACPEGKIDDMEDGDNKLPSTKGRGGYWYTFADKTGTTVSPGDKFSMTKPGADGSRYAAHMSGKIAKGGVVFAGLGVNLADPRHAYDMSSYKGLSFKARIAKGTARDVRVAIADVNTDPEGKVCKDCYNYFGTDLTLTEDWMKYTLPFKDMKQEANWGDQKPALEVSKSYAIQFKINHSGADFDLWVDDVEFACE